MSDHTNKQFDAEMEAIRSGVLSMGGIVEQHRSTSLGGRSHVVDHRRFREGRASDSEAGVRAL